MRRLTKPGRKNSIWQEKIRNRTRLAGPIVPARLAHPSPAEARKQRNLAFSRAKRSLKAIEEADLATAFMMGRHARLPESRGTTTAQLVAMHLEAEQEAEGVKGLFWDVDA